MEAVGAGAEIGGRRQEAGGRRRGIIRGRVRRQPPQRSWSITRACTGGTVLTGRQKSTDTASSAHIEMESSGN